MQTINLRAGGRPASGFGAVAQAALAGAWRTLRVWARIVRTRGELGEMDDRMLADLGISRAQAAFQLTRAPWTLTEHATRR